MRKLSKLLCVMLVASLCACFSSQSSPPSMPQTVKHIIVVWLKEPGNINHRQRLLKSSQQLTQIPGIISVQGGVMIGSNRPVVDSSFDIALVIEMRDKKVLRRYTQHPLHLQLLEEEFEPLIERYRVFDIQ